MANTNSFKRRKKALKSGKADITLSRGAYAIDGMYKQLATKTTETKKGKMIKIEKKHKKKARNQMNDYDAFLISFL